MDPEHDDIKDPENDTPSPPAGSSKETFVRSFSKDPSSFAKFRNRSLHHPFEATDRHPTDDHRAREHDPSDHVRSEEDTSPSQLGDIHEVDQENHLDPGDSSSEDEEPIAPFSPHEAGAADRYEGYRQTQRKRLAYRWIIRAFFFAALATLALMTYDRLFGTSGSARSTSPDPLVNAVRNYRFQLPNRHWEMVDRRPGSEITIARQNPSGRLWIESGLTSPTTSLGTLGDQLRQQWRKDLPGLTEDESSTQLVAGVVAERITANGNSGGVPVRRVGLTLLHHGIWYRIQYEAPIDAFSTIDNECRFAIGNYFRFLTDRPTWTHKVQTDPARFHGIAYQYSLDRPPGEWRIAPELAADSRFADLKLFDQARAATIVVSPRPDATIDQLHSLYVRRQEKRFEDSVTFRNEEDLQIGGNPAKRIQAYIQDDQFGSKVLVTTFIQGDAIAYQIEAETLQENAPNVLPDIAQAVESFQVGPATPKSPPKPPAEEASRDNHFQRAPDWVQPK